MIFRFRRALNPRGILSPVKQNKTSRQTNQQTNKQQKKEKDWIFFIYCDLPLIFPIFLIVYILYDSKVKTCLISLFFARHLVSDNDMRFKRLNCAATQCNMARNRKSKDADDESFDSKESPRIGCVLSTSNANIKNTFKLMA